MNEALVTFAVDNQNSILLEFATPRTPSRQKNAPASYRVALLLGLSERVVYGDDLQNDLADLIRLQRLNKIVVWTQSHLPSDTVRALRADSVDIIAFEQYDFDKVTAISHFIPLAGMDDYRYAILVNTVADLLLRRLKTLTHFVLSEIAAPTYDAEYGKDRFATLSVMRFEDALVQRTVAALAKANRTAIAVDVGCGTGRHALKVAKTFSQVFGFDFSPSMIAVAQKTRAREKLTNVVFAEADFEHGVIPDEPRFYGRADLIIASFGMGSFVEDTSRMLRRFHTWLNVGGAVIVSFYNSDSLLLRARPAWRDTSLAANLDVANKSLRVQLMPNAVFNVYCRPFSKGVGGTFRNIFDDVKLYSYPTTMALMPNAYLAEPLVRDVFQRVDAQLATSPDLLGYYVLAVGWKRDDTREGFERIENLLRSRGFESPRDYDAIDHDPVMSGDDIQRHFGLRAQTFIKTVILRQEGGREFFAIVTFAEKRINRDSFASHVGVARSKISFASEADLRQLGFPHGGIAPFGFSRDVALRGFVDREVLSANTDWVFSGSGDRNKTLHMRKQAFVGLMEGYETIEL